MTRLASISPRSLLPPWRRPAPSIGAIEPAPRSWTQAARHPSIRRLVVLVPDHEVDEVELARRVWTLAVPRALDVLFLGIAARGPAEPRARRRLVTLAALTRDRPMVVEARLSLEAGWLSAVRAVARPGDLVVCHAEQSLGRGVRPQSLGEALVAALDLPVCMFEGFYPELPGPEPAWRTRLVAMLLVASLVIGFFGLQAWVERLTTGGLNVAIESVLALVELGLLAGWYRFFYD